LNIGSGCNIEFINGVVRKSYNSPNSSLYSQYIWMSKMSKELPYLFPKVWGWDGLGYFIEDLSKYPKACDFTGIERSKVIDMCLVTSKRISEIKEVFGINHFNSFLARMDSHWNLMSEYVLKVKHIYVNGREVKNFDYQVFRSVAESMSKDFNSLTSNCHGDMTLENCFVDSDRIILIDPNPTPDCWRSWILDVAKICQSVRFDYEKIFYGNAARIEGDDENISVYITKEKMMWEYWKILDRNFRYANLIKILEVSNYLRMLKYKLAQSEEKFRLALSIGSLLMEEI